MDVTLSESCPSVPQPLVLTVTEPPRNKLEIEINHSRFEGLLVKHLSKHVDYELSVIHFCIIKHINQSM